ncbi:MAG: hypothetical protein EPN21_09795 [Methylococcaceae bacterium]|nr:MAG: hypothetical protein EPN21_09795 [Methylococcaceae bacterium]
MNIAQWFGKSSGGVIVTGNTRLFLANRLESRDHHGRPVKHFPGARRTPKFRYFDEGEPGAKSSWLGLQRVMGLAMAIRAAYRAGTYV